MPCMCSVAFPLTVSISTDAVHPSDSYNRHSLSRTCGRCLTTALGIAQPVVLNMAGAAVPTPGSICTVRRHHLDPCPEE